MLTTPKATQDMAGVNLLVTLLLRYPTIATVGITTDKDQLHLSFLVSDGGDQRYMEFQQRLLDTLTAYFAIEGAVPDEVETHHDCYEGMGLIEVLRDLKTVQHGEIRLIVEVIGEVYGDELIYEPIEAQLEEDELDVQEEWIGMMLENLRRNGDPHSLLALREGGRVLVYNT